MSVHKPTAGWPPQPCQCGWRQTSWLTPRDRSHCQRCGAPHPEWMAEPLSLCQHCGSTEPNHGRCIFEDLIPEDANDQPHQLINDGPTLGGAARWTCSACGKAVLRFSDGKPYGSAWHDPVCRNR